LKAFQQANLEYGEVVQKGGRNTPSRTDRLAKLAEITPSQPSAPAIAPDDELAQIKAQLTEANQTIEQLNGVQTRTQQQLRKAITTLAKMHRNPLWPLASRILALRRGRR
ncbi:MAG: hypothetical protein WBA10_14230, partial [Elainellaceae cyanobacterium]